MGDSESRLIECNTTPRSWTPARYVVWTVVLGLVVLATVDARQYDALAALSAVPPWCWWTGATVVASIALIRCSRRDRLAIAAILLLIGVNWVEQFAGLARSGLDLVSADRSQPWLRVASLNCSTGSRRAAEEVTPLNPDVVLLQESPSEAVLAELATKLFGPRADILTTGDCSILARGKLQLVQDGRHYLHALLDYGDGRQVHVICVRLVPPVVRFDLWAPNCWREYSQVREKRRAQARQVADDLATLAPGDLVVLGGDCNAPAGDGALQDWGPELRDAFTVAGRGWGATVFNQLPVHRFDQIWSTASLPPLRVTAVRSDVSDHRLVVADFSAPKDRRSDQ